MITPRHVIDFIEGKFANANEQPTRAQIAAIIKQITIEQLGISETEYGEDKEFVRDLGVD